MLLLSLLSPPNAKGLRKDGILTTRHVCSLHVKSDDWVTKALILQISEPKEPSRKATICEMKQKLV